MKIIESIKNIFIAIGICLAVFVSGFFIGWFAKGNRTNNPDPVISQGEIVSNKIVRDLSKVPQQQKDTELTCYLTADPWLEIKHVENDEYEMNASLCERKWSRKVRIRPFEYHHIFQAGINKSFDNEQLGAMFGYTYLFSNIGIGCGVATAGVSVGNVWIHATYLK